MDIERKNIEKEYDNIKKSNGISQKISSHRALKTALEQVFRECIGEEEYSVKFNDDSIVILREGNYPEATDGIYKGIKVASRCTIKLESDGGMEYLSVKTENVSITDYPNNHKSSVFYLASVTAYDENGLECARGEYRTNREVQGFKFAPMYMIDSIFVGSVEERPNLDIQFATRANLSSEHSGSSYDWEYRAVIREENLISHGYFLNYDSKTSKKNSLQSYGTINPYNYEKLCGNTNEFARLTEVSGNVSSWNTVNGEPLTYEELRNLINEHKVDLDEYLSSGRSR